MNAAVTRRALKEFALIFLLVSAAAVPLIVALAAAVLWIETGSPWAGPTVLTVIAGVVAGSWLAARR